MLPLVLKEPLAWALLPLEQLGRLLGRLQLVSVSLRITASEFGLAELQVVS